MGHDPEVHVDCRMEESTQQLSIISQFLSNMEKGNINAVTDKNHDEINWNDTGDNDETSIEKKLLKKENVTLMHRVNPKHILNPHLRKEKKSWLWEFTNMKEK